MVKVMQESLDTTSWSQYLRDASKGIAESSVRNDPNLGLMVDIDPSQKSIDKAFNNILDLGFKKVDEYIEEVTGDHDSDSYYVFTKGSSEDDRVVIGIVFQLDEFAFINVRYDEIEDAQYFNESKEINNERVVEEDDKDNPLYKEARRQCKLATDWIVGGYENEVMDGYRDEMPSKESLAKEIYNAVMNYRYTGSSEIQGATKGIRFAGKEFIMKYINKYLDASLNESIQITESVHTTGEYTVAVTKKKLGGLDKGRLVHYFIDDVTIFCYISANRDSWLCNLDIDEKDEYLRDLTDAEYNKLCSIGKSATSTADASRMQNEYRLSLVEEIDYADVFGDQSNIYSEDELDDFLYDLAEEYGLDSDDLYDELYDERLITTYDIDRDTGVPLTFHYDPEAIKSYVSKKCESNGIKVEEVEDEYEPCDVG